MRRLGVEGVVDGEEEYTAEGAIAFSQFGEWSCCLNGEF